MATIQFSTFACATCVFQLYYTCGTKGWFFVATGFFYVFALIYKASGRFGCHRSRTGERVFRDGHGRYRKSAAPRGLDQPDPVREGIEDIQRRVQIIMDRLDAQESSRSQAMVTAPTKPDTPVTYVLEPAGWLGRLLLGRVKLTQDRPGSSR